MAGKRGRPKGSAKKKITTDTTDLVTVASLGLNQVEFLKELRQMERALTDLNRGMSEMVGGVNKSFQEFQKRIVTIESRIASNDKANLSVVEGGLKESK